MSKIIIGLVGPIASGKDVTKKYLIEKYGAEAVKFSTPLRDVLNRLHIPISRDNIIDISTILRQRFGQDLLSKVITHDASVLTSDIVIVDGIRRWTDIEHLSLLDNFKLVKIEADSKIRFERMRIRNENVGDDKKSYQEFMADHERETEITIPGVMEKAKYSLNNDGTFEDLYKKIDLLIAEFNKA